VWTGGSGRHLISDEATLDKAGLAVVSTRSFLGENGVAEPSAVCTTAAMRNDRGGTKSKRSSESFWPVGDRNYPDFFLGVAVPTQALPQLFARNKKCTQTLTRPR
jgi:hypothetical protein